MRRTILLLVLAASVALLAKEKPVKRLDGSTITAPEIDSTVTHLMKAAEVTGVQIAILNDGKITYAKAS